MNCVSYNGWTNYETWLVGLWLSNDQGTDQYYRELAAAHGAEGLNNGTMATAFRDSVEESLPDLGATLAADLMGAALSEVNWQEVARSFFEV